MIGNCIRCKFREWRQSPSDFQKNIHTPCPFISSRPELLCLFLTTEAALACDLHYWELLIFQHHQNCKEVSSLCVFLTELCILSRHAQSFYFFVQIQFVFISIEIFVAIFKKKFCRNKRKIKRYNFTCCHDCFRINLNESQF